MKIDFVTDTFPPDVNGAAMTLGRLVMGLKACGHSLHVIRTGEPTTPWQTSMKSLRLPGYQEVRIGLPGPFRLRKRWLRERPDVIYIATESPLGHSAMKAARVLGIPVVSGFHTNFQQYMEPYHLAILKAPALAYLLKLHGTAQATVAPSAEVVEMLLKHGLANVHLLERGVDSELFHPRMRDRALRAAWGAADDTPVFLVVGRLAPEKNLDLAVRAFRRVRESAPAAKLVMVGDGPLRAKLAAANPEIEFAGVRLDDDLARHFASADVLLFPSETETFGNVLLEAMASGLVTVSYDYAASARHGVHGINGLKTVKGDAGGFVDLAMEALHLAFDSTLRAAARTTAAALGWAEVVARFEEILREVAGLHLPPSSRWAGYIGAGTYRCRTVFLSDLHLGAPGCKAHEITSFLKRIRCHKLVLNGNIIDGRALRQGNRWRRRHRRVVKTILNKQAKEGTEVIYLRGNHDDVAGCGLPVTLESLGVQDEHIHLGPSGKRYLVLHGGGPARAATWGQWLAGPASIGLGWWLGLRRLARRWRSPASCHQTALANGVDSAGTDGDRDEEQWVKLAQVSRCDGIICGHNHTPEDKQIGGIHYLNTGDWVVSLTAVIEQEDGTLELVRYPEFMERNSSQPALTDQPDPPLGSPLVTEGTGAVTASAGNSTAGRQLG
jgi:glycosyltransferase involved in cell wall biosynthesis/UDP-2,3-diacylglucosamine pyrophosphatase LpxH